MQSKKRKFYPIKDEKVLNRVIQSLDTGYKDMARLILITGIKLSEICNLEFRDLDIDNNRITVGSKVYTVPNKILKKYRDDMQRRFFIHTSSRVFVNQQETGITHRMFQRQMDKLEIALGMPMSYQLLRLTYQYRIYNATHDTSYLRTKGLNASRATLDAILGIKRTDADMIPKVVVTNKNECKILSSLYI